MDGRAEECGRLFEAGFMLGVIRALGTLPTPPSMLAEYRRQREAYRVSEVVEEFIRGAASEADRTAGRVLARYYLFRGHVAGLTFMQEYLEALTPRGERERQGLEVRYWQCSVQGRNSLAMKDRRVETAERAAWLAQVGATGADLKPRDRQKGGFLNADLLLLLRTRRGIHHLLAVDVGAFAGKIDLHNPDLTVGSELLRLLEKDVQYLADKGAFARLAIETGDNAGPLFTDHLTPYFTAFSFDDKESAKLIQAASYAASFRDFARRIGLLGADDGVQYQIVGYSGRGVNSMVLGPAQETILNSCAKIYPLGHPSSPGEGAMQAVIETRDQARQNLYRMISRNAARLFDNGRAFLADLEMAVREGRPVTHTEQLTGFANTKDLRDDHAKAVREALESNRPFVFLTGNPGIGKTTAIAEYLKTQAHAGGYLFFYASPRKVVNQDIFGKFRTPVGAFYSPAFLGLNSNATLIQDAGPGMAVEYLGAADRVPSQSRGIRFLSPDQVADLRQQTRRVGQTRLQPASEDTLRDTGGRTAGVLQSVCKAIGAALDTQRPNALAATVAIQSLKRSQQGDTLDHLREMFAYAYNQRTRRYIPERMRELAATTQRIIFMIDEVTGDAAGYEFFRRVAEFCQDADLVQYGFQVTIVVADASITGIEVVQRHLQLQAQEPDTRKIYLTLDPAGSTSPPPVSSRPFTFRDPDDAYLVNSNSFPASALTLRYKIWARTRDVPEDITGRERRQVFSMRDVDEAVNDNLVQDLCALLASDPAGQEQAIVYVQDKNRLEQIIAAVTFRQQAAGRPFDEGTQYMQIHADIAEATRAQIGDEAIRDRIAVFFITSSASRGLTFAKTRHLFVDVPRFQVESNLMEILQVIYRGRGGPNDAREKTITFYLTDAILTGGDRPAWQVREGLMRLITMLALIKLCIRTRIDGGAVLHGQRISLIPIGGKSVPGGGRAYHHAMEGLAKAIERELRGPRSNNPTLKRLQTAVHRLMDRAEIRLPPSPDSYLTLYREATPAALDAWITGDAPVERAYVHGSLLIVPIQGGDTETLHHMGLAETVSYAVDPATRHAIWTVMYHPEEYAPGLHDGVKELDRLVGELERVDTSQRLEQRSTMQHGYYVMPLAAFVAKEAIARYCQEHTGEEGGREVKQLLREYIGGTYPLDTILPIGWAYEEFPFLVLTSLDLPALRAKTFRSGHTLMSREMNLLTMLLTYEE